MSVTQVSYHFPVSSYPYELCAANMSIAETLEFVNFEWVAERSVKVKIKESILTFST
jgi:hypothetical protein